MDGIVFMGGNITDELVEEFIKSPAPIVLAGSVEDSGKIASVNIDHEQAVYDAINTFIQNGHRKIAFVIGPLHEPVNSEKKLAGYKRALSEAGLNIMKTL